MGKLIPDAKIDLQLDVNEGDNVHVCSAQPTTYAEASATFQLATQAVTGANYTKANGDTNGRKNSVAPAAGTAIDNTGTADHVAVTNGTDLRLVTTCTGQALTQGGTVDIGAFAHEISDAS